MINLGCQIRGKLPYLPHPVCEQCRGHDRNDFPGLQFAFALQFIERCDHLKRLSESHVIRNQRSKPQAEILHEPGVAALLIRAQLRPDIIRHRNLFLAADFTQLLHDVARHLNAGAFNFTGKSPSQALEIPWLTLLLQAFFNRLDLRRIKPHIFIIQLNNLALLFKELQRFGFRQLPASDRNLPAEIREHLLREETAGGTLHGARYFSRQLRTENLSQPLRQQHLRSEQLKSRAGLKEERLQILGHHRERFPLTLQDFSELGAGARQHLETRDHRIAIPLILRIGQDRLQQNRFFSGLMLRGQNSEIQLERLPVPAPHNHDRHPVGRKLIEGERPEVTAQRMDFRITGPLFKTPVAVTE